ncbi:hypothetical protein ACGFIU_09275 [Rhodococcus oryzae]|uniref:hypothetical protein n=1 Tax=Rhodococcus oryzae TaxID=2571143 RepID=UPI00371C30B1
MGMHHTFPTRVVVGFAVAALTATTLLVSAPSVAATPVASTSGPGQQASSAAAFVDSIGVNVHLHYTDTIYDRYDDIIKPRLLELGVKNLRDGIFTDPAASASSTYYQRLRELAQSGMKFNLISSMQTPRGQATDFNKLADVVAWSGGNNAVRTLEGVNEPDAQKVSDWAARTRTVQEQLASTVRSTPTLNDIGIIGPSLTKTESTRALGDLSGLTDYGNIHNYPSDRNPETKGWGPNGYGSLLWNLNYIARPVTAQRPVISTETGYYNSPTSDSGVSRTAAATYIPRLLLGSYDAGIRRAFLYELADQKANPNDKEANFGLLDSTGNPKESFKALQGLIHLLSDPQGANFQPGRLDYSLATQARDIQTSLLQKSDGTFFLAVWRAAPVWDVNADRELQVPAAPLHVTLPEGSTARAVHELGQDGLMRTRSLSGLQADLEVGPTVQLVEIGASAPQPTTPAPGSSSS